MDLFRALYSPRPFGFDSAILSGILREERPHMLAVLEAGGWLVTAEDEEDIWWSVAITRR